MEKLALLIIDVQNYFINEHTRSLPAKIASHVGQCDYDSVLFTKFVNQKHSNFVKMLGWDKCTASPDTDICEELRGLANGENVFEKHTLSAFKNPGVKHFLDKNKINKLFICGTDSEACVLSSAFEAFDLGYDVRIIKELCASTNGADFHEYARTIIERNLEPKK